jgi:hypothetical protein
LTFGAEAAARRHGGDAARAPRAPEPAGVSRRLRSYGA